MAKYTNVHNLPRVMVNAITRDSYDNGRPDDVDPARYLTASMITTPPQLLSLRRRHADKIEYDVTELLYAVFGSAGHVILERGADESTLIEQRLYGEHRGWTISGQLDVYDMMERELGDYKFTGVFSVTSGKPKSEWIGQVQTNAWLLRQNNYPVEKAHIAAVLRDWMRSKAERDRRYPQIQFQKVPIPLWSDDQYLSWLEKKLDDLEAAEARQCTDEERWRQSGGYRCVKRSEGPKGRSVKTFSRKADAEAFCAEKNVRSNFTIEPRGTRFAAVRKGSKKALKVFDFQEDAQEYIKSKVQQEDDNHLVVLPSPVKYIRCEHYCPVRQWCSQQRETEALNEQHSSSVSDSSLGLFSTEDPSVAF